MYNEAIKIDPKNADVFNNKGSNFTFNFLITSFITR